MLPIGHPQGVTDAAFSPDGKLIVTQSYNDVNAKVWNAKTGELLFNFPMQSTLSTARFTRDSRSVVTLCENKGIVWSLETGTPVTSFAIDSALSFFELGMMEHLDHFYTTSENILQIWNTAGNLVKAHAFDMPIHHVARGSSDSTLLIVTKDSSNRSDLVSLSVFSGNRKQIITRKIFSAVFSKLHFVLVFEKGRSSLYSKKTEKQLSGFTVGEGEITSYSLSAKGDKLLLGFADSSLAVYQTKNGKEVMAFGLEDRMIRNLEFVGNGETFIMYDEFRWPKLVQTSTGDYLYTFTKDTSSLVNRNVNSFISFSRDGKRVLMVFEDNVVRLWKLGTKPVLEQTFKVKTTGITAKARSSDNVHFAVGNQIGEVKVYNVTNGVVALSLQAGYSDINDLKFSRDGRLLISASDTICKVWKFPSGELLQELTHSGIVTAVDISNDGRNILTSTDTYFFQLNDDTTVRVWDWAAGKVIKSLSRMKSDRFFSARYSADNKTFICTNPGDSTVRLLNAETLKETWRYNAGEWLYNTREGNANSQLLLLSASAVSLVDIDSMKAVKRFPVDNEWGGAEYDISLDGKTLITGERGGLIKQWHVAKEEVIHQLKGHTSGVNPLLMAGDSVLVTASEDGTIKVWSFPDIVTKFQIIPLPNNENLIVDRDNRYDGSENARKLLYFTCAAEVIDLLQVKDQLWVPNLAERIMKGETINSLKLSDLNICGLTPTVTAKETKNGYEYTIYPRRGGLGETILYVNGIETKRYLSSALVRKGDVYQLFVSNAELRRFFVAGQNNSVSVKAYTKENDIASRGVEVSKSTDALSTAPPNLYAVIIGVSDYKGEELDLRYAAKDATDIANTVAASATKLLGKEHVFVYNLSTTKERTALPEKKSIQNVFTEIGRKAGPNDILLVFFAGHGVIQGKENQFYFLTADAAASSLTPSGVRDVGISAAELTEWMKPDKIRAQKRILILDACNSGQAINQIVTIGSKDQNYLAARNDVDAQQIKQIDRLNEKAGLYVLAASASNQSAYEFGKYSQGLLTYALLKVIKEQPEILEKNKFLNVSNWFNSAVKLVSDLVKENRLRQEPQLITTTNFNIGIVDAEVLSSIQLANAKPLFTAANFQNNDPAILDDDLGLTTIINQRLNTITSRSATSKIAFSNLSSAGDAWWLVGRYDVLGNEIRIKANLKQNNRIMVPLEVNGPAGTIQHLAEKLIDKAIAWIETNK